MNVEFHPAADAELRAAAAFYEARVPGLGDDFLKEVERVCSLRASTNRWDRDSMRSIIGFR